MSSVPETSARKQRSIGLLIVLITFGLFGGWSLTAPLQKAALAPGVIVLEGNRKTVQHLEGGVVNEILIKEGAQVQAGELLLRLEDTQLQAQLDIAKSQLYALTAKQARLKAERGREDAVLFPALLVDSDTDSARDAVRVQQQIFTARRGLYQSEVDVLNQQVEQQNSEISGVTSLRSSKRKLVRSYTREIRDFESLMNDGYAEKTRLRELFRSKARLEGEVAEHTATIARIKTRIAETQLKILQVKKEFHTAVVDELSTIQAEVYDIDERVKALTDRVAKSQIVSPVAGKVLGLAAHTIGGVVAPGEPILHVVSDSDALVVDARVSPMDIDRVKAGQSAKIRFSSFNSQTTPVIDGDVLNVSADALLDEQSGASYFMARVRVTKVGYDMLGSLVLVPGMPVEVLITTGSRTLFQYMTQPIRNGFARALIED